MAFSSISKMTVPIGADGTTDATGLLMPKLTYRFRVNFINFGGETSGELTRQVVSFTRPNLNFGEIPIEIYNSRIYLAAKPTWEAVNVVLRDDATGSVANLVGKQIQKQFDFSEQASAAAGSDYKFKIQCQILDGARSAGQSNVLEAWELYGCYIASANYNELNYGTSEAVTISLSIRFDNAVQTPLDTTTDGPAFGVGSAIGTRATGDNVSGIGSSSTATTAAAA